MIYLVLLLKILRNKVKYDKFRETYLNITKERYLSNNDLKRNIPNADIYICGSDQIWNTKFNNGKDPAFYLDFVPKEKVKVAYAASFATDSIDKEVKEITKERISKLDYVGVREISALDILNRLGIKNGVQVLDPVFLLNKFEWEELTYEINSNEKYIFVYDFDGNELIRDVALKLAKEKKLKIYTVFKSNYSDKVIKNMGPIDFISYIKNAEFVISNSFHGTAFSIIFERQFAVVNRKEAINTRMRDLLNILNINHRLIGKKDDFDNIVKNVDYNKINKYLKEKIKLSKSYLDRVVSSKNKLGELNEKEGATCN